MKLRERLEVGREGTRRKPSSPQLPAAYQEVKRQLHSKLVDGLDLAKLEKLEPAELRAELRATITAMVSAEELPLNRLERDRLVVELVDEVMGLGPLEPLLADPTVSDILVNGYKTIYIERAGKLSRVEHRFRDNDHLLQIIGRIVARIGRRIDETSPMVDARLPDGSRVNAIIPPLAIDGPALSIRRFGVRPLGARDLVAHGTVNDAMLHFLGAAVRAKLNILVSGGTGTGKTTLLNVLSSYIPDGERILTIEDAAELQLQQRHVVRLETRPPNVEGRGAVVQRDLVRNSLRMRPDRIIVGEVRGEEVLDMLQAMNTGHEGSMTTVHANSPRDALHRLVQMAGMASANFSEHLLNVSVARALDLIVHLSRFLDGKRRVVSISEITGMEGQVITTQDIFTFDQRGVDADDNVIGELVFTGIRPKCMDRIVRAGGMQGGPTT